MDVHDIYGYDNLIYIVKKQFNKNISQVDIHIQWLKFQVEGSDKYYILKTWESPDAYHGGVFNLRRELTFIRYCQQI